MWEKIINFVTGGLPSEIAKQVGEHIRAKGANALKVFQAELAYDLKVLSVTSKDPLCTRQGIAWTFHFFMWITKVWTGHFPADIIFTWEGNDLTIGFVYVLIIAFYFPFRAIEKFTNFLGKK